ncbi:Uncharacterised protein [Legionella pneumophila]|nr:Uncharacterised protein [Legionella pneumophila]
MANKILSFLASNNASSVTVPGVMIRVTCLSTGPLLVAGSPICSQMATDSPFFNNRAK